MSMHGKGITISDDARRLITEVLGDDPTIAVHPLRGDNARGVTTGTFTVIDEPHPTVGAVRHRVVKLGDALVNDLLWQRGYTVFGPVLVAATDKLTHEKAEAVLRSFAAVGGWKVFPAAPKVAKLEGIDEKPTQADKARVIEYHLDEIDRWRSGEKATAGQPANGERYALAMREGVKHHVKALRVLGVELDDSGNPV